MNHARHPIPVHPDQILDELAAYLRPPGQGIHAFSTGKEAIDAATAAYLGDAWNPSDSWRGHLSTLATAPPPIALLAIPCDTGAGIVRGAAWGPAAIREGLGAAPVFDLGAPRLNSPGPEPRCTPTSPRRSAPPCRSLP